MLPSQGNFLGLVGVKGNQLNRSGFLREPLPRLIAFFGQTSRVPTLKKKSNKLCSAILGKNGEGKFKLTPEDLKWDPHGSSCTRIFSVAFNPLINREYPRNAWSKF